MTDETLPHSRCMTCGIDLPTLTDAREHMVATIPAPVGTSHVTTILNPTEDERRASRARSLVKEAIFAAMEHIGEGRGDLTCQEVREALSRVDLDDEWSDWCEQ